MTLQTELVGEPAQLVTLIDFRGRVLQRWTSPDSVENPDQIRRWHGDIEAQVRTKLSRVAARTTEAESRWAEKRFGAHLFVEAMRAYAHRDLATALALIEACAGLLPDDQRVRTARARFIAASEVRGRKSSGR